LILSDIAMPVMDGYAMCHAKSDPALQDIPIILLTALSQTLRHHSRPEREGRQLPHETLRRGYTARSHRTSAGESDSRKDAKFQFGMEIFFAGRST
jgi:CheY-like chemotaxis protein